MIKRIFLGACLLFAATSLAAAQSLPNYGPNAPATGDSFGKPYSGARPLPQRGGYRSYAYMRGHHHHAWRWHRHHRYYR